MFQMTRVSSSPKSSLGERQPWTAVWGECTDLGEQPHQGVSRDIPRHSLGSSCPPPLPSSTASLVPSPQPVPLSAGMPTVLCHQPLFYSQPSSPPCARLQLLSFTLQPGTGSSLSPHLPSPPRLRHGVQPHCLPLREGSHSHPGRQDLAVLSSSLSHKGLRSWRRVAWAGGSPGELRATLCPQGE